jgi:imidazolonepropionase-like amidohydrolase
MKNISYFLHFLCFIWFFIFFTSIQGYPQKQVVAIKGGKLVTVTKGVIAEGVILINQGRIIKVGKDISIPKRATVIDATNYYVLPGFIDAGTNLGAAEINSLGNDDDESTSPITPHMRIIDSINPENRFIKLARSTGLTSVLSAPGEGNLLSGQSAMIQLYGGTVEEMILSFPVGIHGSLGELPKLRFGTKGGYPMTRMGEAALLRQTLIETQEYLSRIEKYKKSTKTKQRNKKKGKTKNTVTSPPAMNLKLHSLVPIVKGEIPLIIRANRLDDILTALRIAKEFNLKIILNHGAEAYKVADQLAASNIPVIIGPVSDMHQRMETQNALFENASRLYHAGVKFAFQTGSIKNLNSLLLMTRRAVIHGLPAEEALRAITINPAQILKVDHQIGSLERGKLANMVIFDGDPIKSNPKLKLVIIKGEIM